MMGSRREGLLTCLVLAALAGTVRAEEAPPHEALVEKVAKRLLDHMERVEGYDPWPPKVVVLNEPEINAFAWAQEVPTLKGPKRAGFVGITTANLNKVIRLPQDPDPDGAEDRLAFMLGHELSHILLGHVKAAKRGETRFAKNAFSRQQEIDADVCGMELALKAGYSLKRGRGSIERMMKLGLDYSSFEGLAVDHPSWKDRLSHLDHEHARLWRSMSAFQNGFFFLGAEQYAAAEQCFTAVTREFPDSHEAWANLGYARLMQYCDGLDTDDLRRYDLGLIAVGGFYQRPGSLEEKLRGRDEKQWRAAEAALRKALELKQDLALAHANLGVAYLVHPSGTRDLENATKHLQQAIAQLQNDKDVKPWMRASVFVNAAVADLAAGRRAEALKKLQQAREAYQQQFGGEGSGRVAPGDVLGGLAQALGYNTALCEAGSDDQELRRKALRKMTVMLIYLNTSSAWWPLAYERYGKLCKELGVPPRPEREFQTSGTSNPRSLVSVTLPSRVTLVLSEPLDEVKRQLGAGIVEPIYPDSKTLVRLSYPDAGVAVVADQHHVLAIYLRDAKAGPLPVRGRGMGSKGAELRVGMSKNELDKVLEDEDFSFQSFEQAGTFYRSYPGLGLAVRVRKDKVEELGVTLVTRRRPIQDY